MFEAVSRKDYYFLLLPPEKLSMDLQWIVQWIPPAITDTIENRFLFSYRMAVDLRYVQEKNEPP